MLIFGRKYFMDGLLVIGGIHKGRPKQGEGTNLGHLCCNSDFMLLRPIHLADLTRKQGRIGHQHPPCQQPHPGWPHHLQYPYWSWGPDTAVPDWLWAGVRRQVPGEQGGEPVRPGGGPGDYPQGDRVHVRGDPLVLPEGQEGPAEITRKYKEIRMRGRERAMLG